MADASRPRNGRPLPAWRRPAGTAEDAATIVASQDPVGAATLTLEPERPAPLALGPSGEPVVEIYGWTRGHDGSWSRAAEKDARAPIERRGRGRGAQPRPAPAPTPAPQPAAAVVAETPDESTAVHAIPPVEPIADDPIPAPPPEATVEEPAPEIAESKSEVPVAEEEPVVPTPDDEPPAPSDIVAEPVIIESSEYAPPASEPLNEQDVPPPPPEEPGMPVIVPGQALVPGVDAGFGAGFGTIGAQAGTAAVAGAAAVAVTPPSPTMPTPDRSTAKSGKRRVRRVKLRASRLGILSVLRTALMFSVAVGIVLFIAMVVVWMIIDRSGVLGSIQGIIDSLVGNGGGTSNLQISRYLDTQRVLGFAAAFSVLNIVLITLLITVFAGVYNAIAAIFGGIEMTLSED